jgi:hypothetical protein
MSLGARRHRITLMGESMQRGAGGRLTRERPIMADVWAEASLSGIVSGGENGTALTEKASITTAYHAGYLAARFAEWDGSLFRIDAYRLIGTTSRQIIFEASRLKA